MGGNTSNLDNVIMLPMFMLHKYAQIKTKVMGILNWFQASISAHQLETNLQREIQKKI